MKRILGLLLVFFVMEIALFAEVPNELNYSGRLREFGSPVTGDRTMNFKIYSTAKDPGLVWESGNQTIQVKNGVFQTVLYPAVDWRGKNYWIETVVNGRTLSPREKITSQVYAFHAQTAEDIATSAGSTISLTIGDNTCMAISESEVKSTIKGTDYFMIPRGAIIMWSGSKIPSGWALCDGSNGTPDLRDRFILGANTINEAGQTGGSNSYSLSVSQMPAHSHTGTTTAEGLHSHSGTTTSNGNHTHSYLTHSNTMSSDPVGSTSFYGAWRHETMIDTPLAGDHTHNFSIGQQGSHNHSFTTTTEGSGLAIDNRPSYFKLAFIMKL
jgi:microcystin-dependent protein